MRGGGGEKRKEDGGWSEELLSGLEGIVWDIIHKCDITMLCTNSILHSSILQNDVKQASFHRGHGVSGEPYLLSC